MENANQNVLLSLILPVYNVEAYLQECVDSILEQITDECEVILVDDGSKDSSGEICRRYAEENAGVRLVQQENGGLSAARNAGLAIASGKYVTFVDSDDKLFPNCISTVLDWAKSENTDLCFLRASKLFPDGRLNDLGENIIRSGLYKQNREKAVQHLASRPKYPGSAWAKLYRRQFLLDNKFHFPYDRRYSEDLGFMCDCILSARSFDALEIPFYQYRQSRQGSITHKATSKNFYDIFRFITEFSERLTVHEKPKNPVSGYAMGFVAYEYVILLFNYGVLPPEEKEAALDKLKEFKWTLKYAQNAKGRVIALLSTVLGLKLSAALLWQYGKANR